MKYVSYVSPTPSSVTILNQTAYANTVALATSGASGASLLAAASTDTMTPSQAFAMLPDLQRQRLNACFIDRDREECIEKSQAIGKAQAILTCNPEKWAALLEARAADSSVQRFFNTSRWNVARSITPTVGDVAVSMTGAGLSPTL